MGRGLHARGLVQGDVRVGGERTEGDVGQIRGGNRADQIAIFLLSDGEIPSMA